MDGFKGRLKRSIQLRLSFWLLLAILAVALIAGVFSFAAAFNEAQELQDDTLRQIAALFDRRHLPDAHLGDRGRLPGSNEESRVIVQYLSGNAANGNSADANPSPALPASLIDGLQTVKIKGEPHRVLVKTLATGERIAVAQETGIRDEIARDSALRTLMPLLILMPLLLLVVAALVRSMFRPIAALSVEIEQRSEQELHPLAPDKLPTEIRPFVVAINQLLHRVSQSMEAQRRFVADAAHELRSPLTALSLQAERLADAEMPDAARERVATLRRGIERGRNLLDQLLTLARVQSEPVKPVAAVPVERIYRRVLEDLMPLATAKNIDIGVEGAAEAEILANEIDLITIVRNLVDNAIRYTPDGGRIDLSEYVSEGKVVLQVRDSGPGISPEERSRIFDPFYRIAGNGAIGSGLGLSIVQTIAGRIGAQVHIGYSDEAAQTGTCVTVTIQSFA
ncbi:ATP-binding protein [Paralcaligenes ginsengisoli]